MKFNFKKILVFIMATLVAVSCLSIVAYADNTPAASPTAKPQQGSGASGWLLIGGYILFFVVIGYFLIYRPNKKRKKQEEELRNSITLGDEVTTIGGIVGRVVNIKDDNVTIESSLDKTLMEFKNWAIREIKKPISDDEPESK